MRRAGKLLSVLAVAALGVTAWTLQNVEDTRPNILLIVADALGYADLGVFGSDIRTPNIDALAVDRILFSQFHTAPLCAPTRAMLLSGNNNHVAGMGRQPPSSGAGGPLCPVPEATALVRTAVSIGGGGGRFHGLKSQVPQALILRLFTRLETASFT